MRSPDLYERLAGSPETCKHMADPGQKDKQCSGFALVGPFKGLHGAEKGHIGLLRGYTGPFQEPYKATYGPFKSNTRLYRQRAITLLPKLHRDPCENESRSLLGKKTLASDELRCRPSYKDFQVRYFQMSRRCALKSEGTPDFMPRLFMFRLSLYCC